jgi:uncharacterized membrane protein
MDPILILLALAIPIFVFVGSVVAFMAMSRTTKLDRTIERYRDMVSDLVIRLTDISRRLSVLEGKPGVPKKPAPPPVVSILRPAEPSQALGPKPPQQPPEELPATVVQPEIVHPVSTPPPIVPLAPEPKPEPEPRIETAPPPPPPTPKPKPVAEPRPAAAVASKTDWTNFESAAGKRWLTWAGVIILFLSIAFFVRHLFQVGWIGPGTQVLLSVGAGLVMLAMGEYFLRQDMRALGRGLIGGGIMVLYAALFAAYSPVYSEKIYGSPVIESQALTFALMCLVTVIAMVLAIRHDAISISFLAVLGGMLTPVLLRTGTDSRDALFSYILLLDLGVLGVAFYKKWRALDILAFAGTIAMFLGWWLQYGSGNPIHAQLAWLAAFWSVFAIIPVAHHIRHKTELTVERLVMSLANATFGFAMAYQILSGRPKDLAWAVLLMSGAYLTLGVLIRLRSKDAKAMFGFIAMSITFLTLFAPLRFELNGITMAWLAEAVLLVYLGFLFDYRPARLGGFITLLLGSARVFMSHYPIAMDQGAQLAAFANTNFWTMMCAPIAAGMIAIVQQGYRRKAGPDDKQIQLICTIGSGLLAILLLSYEMDRWFNAQQQFDPVYRRYIQYCATIVLWAIGSSAFLAGLKSRMSHPLKIAGLLPLVGSLLLAVYAFNFADPEARHLLAINPLFGATLLVCGVMWAYSLTWTDQKTRIACGIGAGLITLLLFSLELDRWLWTLEELGGPYLDYLHHSSMSVLWAVGALAFLVGARRCSTPQPVRCAGLFPLLGSLLVAAGTFTIADSETPHLLAINPLFGAALLACGIMWAYSLAWTDQKIRTACGIGAGLITLMFFSLELDRWFWTLDTIPGPYLEYLHHCAMAVLWAVGALGFAGAARFSSTPQPLRSAALLPLGAAALLIAYTFSLNSGLQHMLFVSPLFGAAFFVCGAMWLTSLTWPQKESKTALTIATSYATITLLCAEVILWIWRMGPEWGIQPEFTCWSVAAMLLAGSAAVYLAFGRLRHNTEAYFAGLAPLALAWMCGMRLFWIAGPDGMTMFANQRFVAAIMTLAVLLAWPAVMRSDRRMAGKPNDAIIPLYVWFTASFLALLTAEPAGWCSRNVADPDQSARIIQMSISIVWGLYATGMLSIGFWKRVMPLRLAALALFAVTAGKLLLVDMANVGQIYRIISFFVMGLLMVAASYLYHKAEKNLKNSEQIIDDQ